MTKKDKIALADKLDWEGGFDAFIYYSDFASIKDKRFHELRQAFVEAYKALEQYIEVDE